MKQQLVTTMFLLLVPISVIAEVRCSGLIAPGQPHQTRWYCIDSEVSGPTVVITGGIHGDEPAGHRAADQIRDWSVRSGRMYVIPRCNIQAISIGSRRFPGIKGDEGDLNRHFARSGGETGPTSELADDLWEFIASCAPAALLDLHEGYGFRSAGSKSVGSSIITHRDVDHEHQSRMLEHVNTQDKAPEHPFVPLRSAVNGSLVRAVAEVLRIEAHILETTTSGQPLSRRTRQHRVMVAARLDRLGMIQFGDAVDLLVADHERRRVVGIYDGPGAGGTSQGNRIESQLPGIRVERIGPSDINAGALSCFDAVIFPGGSGSAQAAAITGEGRRRIRSFVRDGGGYIGICAGSYLALHNYDWGLKLLPLDSMDRKHWRRGNALLELSLTDEGRTMLGRDGVDVMDIQFRQGPLMSPSEHPDAEELPEPIILATYNTGVGRNGADPGIMIDTPAIVAGDHGLGRVFLFSPHPEKTAGLEDLLARAINWCVPVPSAAD